ncbi:MAG: DUF4422 domain-containing protein [Clostridiales bacterium]|nr:DUF4422 domain-containing protein [Clostridiales bacterium]
MNIKIAVATTKEYRMPQDSIYMPVQVGACGKPSIGYARDDDGENISLKNPQYCELTALYWMWKNSDADYIGLVHYRRHFGKAAGRLPWGDAYRKIADRATVEHILKSSDIILPKKRHYYIESLYTHYAHSHYEEHLEAVRKIIAEQYPGYLDSFGKVMRRTGGHMFNMLIMKKDRLDEYLSWLFPILTQLEEEIDSSGYDAFQKRYPGRIAELMLDVWIDYNGYAYWELPVITLGRVHWGRKIFSFLRARLFGTRYKKSF